MNNIPPIMAAALQPFAPRGGRPPPKYTAERIDGPGDMPTYLIERAQILVTTEHALAEVVACLQGKQGRAFGRTAASWSEFINTDAACDHPDGVISLLLLGAPTVDGDAARARLYEAIRQRAEACANE